MGKTPFGNAEPQTGVLLQRRAHDQVVMDADDQEQVSGWGAQLRRVSNGKLGLNWGEGAGGVQKLSVDPDRCGEAAAKNFDNSAGGMAIP